MSSHRLRVLLVGYLYGRGGIQGHTHWLAMGLGERGCDVEVITPAPIHDHSSQRQYAGPYPVRTYARGNPLRTAAAVWQYVRRGRFDVAVVCGTGWLAMTGVLANRRIRRRVFFEVMSGERNRRMDPRALVHAGFDAIVGQAPTVEEKFCGEFRWHGLRTTIPALPDPLEKSACISTPARDLSQGIRAAYFGRLDAHKGVGYLVDRWDELSNHIATLDVYGAGPQEAELHEKIAARGLGSRIRLHGSYPAGAEYIKLLQQHHLVLLPTTGKEGAPLVLLEAMACGVPFVANGVGGIPGYANPDCGITSGDVAEFIPLVGEMCRRLRSGDVDSERLQRHYAEHFSFVALRDRWYDFLMDLCRGGQS